MLNSANLLEAKNFPDVEIITTNHANRCELQLKRDNKIIMVLKRNSIINLDGRTMAVIESIEKHGNNSATIKVNNGEITDLKLEELLKILNIAG